MFRAIGRAIKRRWSPDRRFYAMAYDLFGIIPDNIELYKAALIHRSASIPLPGRRAVNNERLEFLGDAILEGVVSDYLFVEFPDEDEGFMTKLRSKIVSRSSLDGLCHSIGLDKYIISESTGAYTHKHIGGDALEAVIGAIYLDKGYNRVNRLLINDIFPNYLNLEDITATETDHKSRLIEWCQRSKHDIAFVTVRSSRSKPNRPLFESTIRINSIRLGTGAGESKKEAEQNASATVLALLSDEVGDYLLAGIDNYADEQRCG